MTCHICAKPNCIGECEPVVFNSLAALKHKTTVGPIEQAMINAQNMLRRQPVQHARDAVTWTPETGYVFKEKPSTRQPLSHDFAYWWFEHGSGITPLEGEDQEQHAFRVASEAWQAAIRAVTIS